MALSIVTWNVNSLKARADYVARFLDAESPDILAIQELKLATDKVPRDLFESRGYHLAIHGQKQWNGVLIASKEPITDQMSGLPEADEGQARLVACTTSGLKLVNLYCPQGQNTDSPKFPYKLSFFDALNDWLRENYRPDEDLIVLGDINIAPTADDLWDPAAFEGVPSFHPKEHERWQTMMDFGLEDAVLPHIEKGTYSFWDYRMGRFRYNHGMRIDHILVTPSVMEQVVDAGVMRSWRKKVDGMTASDHAPVFTKLK